MSKHRYPDEDDDDDDAPLPAPIIIEDGDAMEITIPDNKVAPPAVVIDLEEEVDRSTGCTATQAYEDLRRVLCDVNGMPPPGPVRERGTRRRAHSSRRLMWLNEPDQKPMNTLQDI